MKLLEFPSSILVSSLFIHTDAIAGYTIIRWIVFLLVLCPGHLHMQVVLQKQLPLKLWTISSCALIESHPTNIGFHRWDCKAISTPLWTAIGIIGPPWYCYCCCLKTEPEDWRGFFWRPSSWRTQRDFRNFRWECSLFKLFDMPLACETHTLI